MMKKSLLLTAVFALSAVSLHAQKIYLCEGFDVDDITLTDPSNVVFSKDQTTVTIEGTAYNISDIDSITFAEPQFESVDVVWSESGATVTIPASLKSMVSASTNGGHVTIVSTATNKEILYTLSGSSSNGSFTLNGNYKLTMHLDGVSLTSGTSVPPINVLCGKRIEVKMKKGTVNTFVDSPLNTSKGAFYVKGHLEVKGKGALNVTGKSSHAMKIGEYCQFKSSTGDVNILGAVSDGIHCGDGSALTADYEDNRLIVNGGNITVSNCQKDCIDCDDYGTAIINGGTINLNVSQTDGTGLKADSIVYMNGGTLNLNVTGNISEGIRYCYEGYFNGGTIQGTITGAGARGLKAKRTTSTSDTVLNGGNSYWNGTNVTLSATGGTYTADSSKCMGLRSDNNMTVTAGTIAITTSNSSTGISVKGAYSKTGGSVTVNGSEFKQ
jgi:hypothetical protein